MTSRISLIIVGSSSVLESLFSFEVTILAFCELVDRSRWGPQSDARSLELVAKRFVIHQCHHVSIV